MAEEKTINEAPLGNKHCRYEKLVSTVKAACGGPDFLSDYTFAVRDGQKLLNVGRAYSGLTDGEMLEYAEFFLQHTIEDQDYRRIVEAKIVPEVAFNNKQKSTPQESGYALRFPRIVGLRTDKAAWGV
jgi:ATP-dependent DNA ligase